MTWIPTEADHVAAEQVRHWFAQGLTWDEMVEAVTLRPASGSTPDDAHYCIAAAWDLLDAGRR